MNASCRNLVLILGDQLDADSAVFETFDPDQDRLWMAENAEEASYVWSHKIRLAFFFSCMRHFRDEQRNLGRTVEYHELTADGRQDSGRGFSDILKSSVRDLRPEKLIWVLPGDHRVATTLEKTANEMELPYEVLPDHHFYTTPEEFEGYARGRKNLVMEYFYRGLRKRFDVLVDKDGKPEGGDWNYDSENRETFGRQGPEDLPPPPGIEPDELTKGVIDMVEKRFADHPGNVEGFDYPVTREQAASELRNFIRHRLPNFGTYEDAMWRGESSLYHSRLSAVMNNKLLPARECVAQAVKAYENGEAPLNSVEGYVRQILGWREFIRGIYWHEMPGYAERNALHTGDTDVPKFFWDGDTDMACVSDCMASVLNHAWAHHIPRLMVLGQFSLLLGVHPYRFHEWHMAMYVDAIDWVSLPNTLGMSQYGDGGIVGTKPYCASGNYIRKMGNHCTSCKYNPAHATGEDACPFTTLYWDFLDRHRKSFDGNRRMTFQMKNLERKDEDTMKEIRCKARTIKSTLAHGGKV
jgi:deoxyribodipyrimidine photolyase-related protein